MLIPVPPFALGSTPVTPVARFISGKSAPTKLLNVGVPADPFGAAKTVFAVSDASVAVNVPLDVTGDPLTVKIPGSDSPTLVTVPVVGVAQLAALPLIAVRT